MAEKNAVSAALDEVVKALRMSKGFNDKSVEVGFDKAADYLESRSNAIQDALFPPPAPAPAAVEAPAPAPVVEAPAPAPAPVVEAAPAAPAQPVPPQPAAVAQ